MSSEANTIVISSSSFGSAGETEIGLVEKTDNLASSFLLESVCDFPDWQATQLILSASLNIRHVVHCQLPSLGSNLEKALVLSATASSSKAS